MSTSLFIALQFMREGRTQSGLICSAVGIGVAVIVFLSALISGLQEDLLAKTLGTQPHVVLRLPEEAPRPLTAAETDDGRHVITQIEGAAQRTRGIVGWQRVLDALRSDERVIAASPVVSGPAFAVRGSVSKSVRLIGIEPALHRDVIDVPGNITAGRMLRGGAEVNVGVTLADDLGLGVGSKLRIAAPGDQSQLFVIVGIFDLGNQAVNEGWVLAPLRGGQTLLGQVGAISEVDIKLRDPFAADSVALALAGRTGLEAESWMATNSQLLTALQSQSSSSIMIQFFVVLSVTIGIASVLVVSVVQKSRQIGILRAMGVSRGQVARIFLIQGGLLGVIGSLVGVGLGVALSRAFASGVVDEAGQPMFPIEPDASLMIGASIVAVLTGLLAAALPAMAAGRMDPAEAIRHE